jgi:diguanylate cyclase (GGDEF)-like protein/PAS domain S-box-containing protein
VWDMQVGVLLQGPQAEILLSNPKALKLLGISEDQLLGKTSFDPDWNVIHEDGSPFPGTTHPVPQAIATRRSIQNVVMGVYRPSTADRVWLSVDAEPQLNDDGTIRHVVCSFIDITERKQAEDKLRQLSSAVEHSPVSIVITNADGMIEYVNPKFTEVNGYTLEEVRGKTPRILKSEETAPEVYRALWHDILSGKGWRGEFLNRKKNGDPYWEYSSISAITDSQGNITHFVSVNEDITSRRESEEKIRRLNAGLEQLAMTDYLTSLYNRRYFMQRGAEEFKRARRNTQPLSLLMLDIDEFKKVNDLYGHEAGDMALQQVAAVLKSGLREVDILGRLGGEEFAVLLPNTLLEDAFLLAERVRQIMESTLFAMPGEALMINITICIGVADFAIGMSSIDDVLRNADAALYRAKYNGRNRVIKYKKLLDEVTGLSSNLDDK